MATSGGTPATVFLERAGIAFTAHAFDHPDGDRHYGEAAASALGLDPDQVFKTLLVTLQGAASTPGRNGAHAVGIVPVSGQLSLKEIATATGARRAEMCDPTVAQRLTGYVVGGISPFGQRSPLTTVIDETCILHERIFVSGGKRGLDLELDPHDLIRALDALVAPIGAPR